MDWYRKIWEVVAKRLLDATLCQITIAKVQRQLKYAMVVIKTRANKINGLKDSIIKQLGKPKNSSVTKKI